mmetsp:Transcript_7988/g.15840  ORF Transcript_7988/g.15840 Transcript_7988/m.15840 type:complete len:255 (-) Transcript_7988:586-1350(-)
MLQPERSRNSRDLLSRRVSARAKQLSAPISLLHRIKVSKTVLLRNASPRAMQPSATILLDLRSSIRNDWFSRKLAASAPVPSFPIRLFSRISTSKEQISKSASARIEAPAFPILQFPKCIYLIFPLASIASARLDILSSSISASILSSVAPFCNSASAVSTSAAQDILTPRRKSRSDCFVYNTPPPPQRQACWLDLALLFLQQHRRPCRVSSPCANERSEGSDRSLAPKFNLNDSSSLHAQILLLFQPRMIVAH